MLTGAEPFRDDFVKACLAGASPEAAVLHRRVTHLAESEIAPRAAEHDREMIYPAGALALLARAGATGLFLPEEHGGLGLPENVAALLVETIAAACPSTAAILMFHYQVVLRTLRFGREPWRSEDLARLASGESFGSSAWTEIGAGADKSGIRTTLARGGGGGGARICGEKHFCTGLEGAGIIHVLARDEGSGPPSISFVRIPANLPGVEIPEIYPLLGLRASSTGTLLLSDVRVEPHWLLGEIGEGPELMRRNHAFLMNPGLLALGIARAALAQAKAAVTGRDHGSKDVRAVQSCRFEIVEIEAALAQAYALASAAARAGASGEPAMSYASNLRLKLVASRVAVDVAQRSMMLAGGRGFHGAWPYERLLRDAFATRIMGPPEAMIKEMLGGAALDGLSEKPAVTADPRLERA
jgi:alkylation response protein AidB-like acyl-CoA dehydrogenase